ncbi:hypothetical protein Dsin_016017 [Dipteronia sinensis]|uniref:Uncharacterized protein n=1 Tax=Dipteronia sinensis TaxID=43782 RepID=A0AAE0E538_9ROSI|nr:hypothetical protein Dsin_016017 [Dipteronia sinensis]
MKTTLSSSSMLRSLTISLMRLSTSSAVAPLPLTTPFGHQLHHTLQSLQTDSQNANGVLHALVDVSTATQQITLNSLSHFTTCQPAASDRKIIDDYLDFNVKMLDTCNDITEKIDTIRNYVESLKVVSHLLQSNIEPHPTTLARAKHLLDSCHNAMETNKRPFKRFFSQKLAQSSSSDSLLGEILGGSKAVTSMVCEILRTALSFKSKQRLSLLPQSTRSSSWSCSLQLLQKQIKKHQKSGSSMMLVELHQTVKEAHNLRNQIKGRNKTRSGDVEELKTRCEELEAEIKPFEGKVKEMYKHLISVRMALLGILSSQF